MKSDNKNKKIIVLEYSGFKNKAEALRWYKKRKRELKEMCDAIDRIFNCIFPSQHHFCLR